MRTSESISKFIEQSDALKASLDAIRDELREKQNELNSLLDCTDRACDNLETVINFLVIKKDSLRRVGDNLDDLQNELASLEDSSDAAILALQDAIDALSEML